MHDSIRPANCEIGVKEKSRVAQISIQIEKLLLSLNFSPFRNVLRRAHLLERFPL